MDSNPCVDSVFHPCRFTEHGTPTTDVGGGGFANWSQGSRTDYLLQKLYSQFKSRIINRLGKNLTPQRPKFSESYSNSNIGGKAALTPQLASISTRRFREGRAA